MSTLTNACSVHIYGAKGYYQKMQDAGENLTQLLERAAAGDPKANDDLFAHIYPTLRKLARSQLNAHRRGTICTTELVNEASMRLFGAENSVISYSETLSGPGYGDIDSCIRGD